MQLGWLIRMLGFFCVLGLAGGCGAGGSSPGGPEAQKTAKEAHAKRHKGLNALAKEVQKDKAIQALKKKAGHRGG
jgi:hypothetical protein